MLFYIILALFATFFHAFALDEKILDDGAVYVGQNYFWEASAYYWSIYKPSDGFYLNKQCDEGASVATITGIVTGKENVESLPEREEAYKHYNNIIHIN